MERHHIDDTADDLASTFLKISNKLSQLEEIKAQLSDQHVVSTTTRNRLLESYETLPTADQLHRSYSDSILTAEQSSSSSTRRLPAIKSLYDHVPQSKQTLTRLTMDTHSAQRGESELLEIVEELFTLLRDATHKTALQHTDSQQVSTSQNLPATKSQPPAYVDAYYDKDEDVRTLAGRLVNLQLDHQDEIVTRRIVRESNRINDPATPLFEAFYQAQYDSVRHALDQAVAEGDILKEICQRAGWDVDSETPRQVSVRTHSEGGHKRTMSGDESTRTNQFVALERPWDLVRSISGTATTYPPSHGIDIEPISAARQTQNTPPPNPVNATKLLAWARGVVSEPPTDNLLALERPEDFYDDRSVRQSTDQTTVTPLTPSRSASMHDSWRTSFPAEHDCRDKLFSIHT